MDTSEVKYYFVIEFMKCFFRSFDVGTGDCNVIRFVEEGFQFSIFVDCGSYNKSVKDYVENVLNSHIDILVITHVDNDHISGIAKMLNDNDQLKIEQIWYNVYRRVEGTELNPLSDEQSRIIERLRKKLPIEMDALTGKREISERQGMDVARCLLENESWNAAWRMEPISSEEKPIDLPNGLGRVVFLSPTSKGIEAINAQFKDAFNKYFMQVWKEGLDKGESVFEILLRLCGGVENGSIKLPISAEDKQELDINFIEEASNKEEKDKSITNYASIAFIIECGGHKIAMLGDAHDDVLVEQIKEKYNELPLVCDAIKVSHHGSNGNNSKVLHELLSATKYYVPGGRNDEYPTWGTIGRIARYSAEKATKDIVFSHKNAITKSMAELSEDMQDELKIKMLISDQEYELFEW